MKPSKRLQEDSVLTQDTVQVPTLALTDEESLQQSQIQVKLNQAWQQRNQPYPEFGNLTYLQKFENNRNKAHTILPKKVNEEDVIVGSGTLEQKLEAVLSAVNILDLSAEVKAFDKNKNKVVLAGIALGDVIKMTEELEQDEEKKLARQKEMLIQGEVFVEERWVKKYKVSKKLKNKNYNGQIKNVDWTKKLEKFFEGPERTVKYGPNVYLGSITTFDIENQPYIGIVEVKSYSEVEAIFGTWERWKYVSPKLRPFSGTEPGTDSFSQSNKVWTLNAIGVDQVEVAVYQDKFNDELQILLNGMAMLPVGFPLSAISANGSYTITKQVLKAYDNFTYGRSFIQSVEKTSDILDEMLRLMILKTRKSFMPAWVNTSKRVITRRALQPGHISMGFPADALQQIGDTSEGVTQSEFSVIRELTERIDRQTVSPQFTGQQGKSGTTATEVMELQKQAKMTMGLIIFACSLLEKKLGYKRLYNILENYFRPIYSNNISGQEYPTTSREVMLDGLGKGERQIIPTGGEIPDAATIRGLEVAEEVTKGYPVKKIFLNPTELKENVREWFIVVNPREKDATNTEKLLFREMISDLVTISKTIGSRPSPEFIEDEFSRVFEKDRSKVFMKQDAQPMMPMEGFDPNMSSTGMANVGGVPVPNNIPV